MKLYKFFSIFFVISISLLACNQQKNAPTAQNKSKALIIKSYDDYEGEWKKVKALEEKDLGKSIIEQVDSILTRALREENTAQVFKALAYRSKYQNQIEEEATFNILSRFERQIETSDFPLKQLLHSATAEIYYDYYNNNRWRYQNRTTTTNFETKDLREWSLQQILDKVDEHYQASLHRKADLLVYPTQNLEAILAPANKTGAGESFDGTKLRPSLYDFLVDRALAFYQVGEGRVTHPVNEFNVDDYSIFSSVAEYINLPFKTEDTSSGQYKTAVLFKEVLKAHIEDDSPDVLIDFNLDRLAYFYGESQNSQKEKLYLTVLNKLSDQYKNNAMQAEIDFQIANLYYSIGQEYDADSESDEKRWSIKKAYELCKKHVNESSYGAEECKYLINRIEKKPFGFQVEKTYLPNMPNLVRLNYKNLDSLYFKIVRIPHEIEVQQRNYRDEENFVKKINAANPKATWTSSLSNPGDFQEHSTEIKIKELAVGRYVLIASEDADFNQTEKIDYAIFSVSELAHINKQSSSSAAKLFYILNRASGKAVAKAKVIAYAKEYDYKTRTSTVKKLGEYYSNTLGQVEIKKVGRNDNFSIVVVHKGDTLGLDENFYLYNHGNNRREKSYLTTYYFTDRAIYRPGQTVYYKGIVIEKNKNNNKARISFSTEPTLINVNGEKLKTNKHRTNNFGSFQGSFTLPASGLNGFYRIQGKHGSISFSVEEYKRPTFEIKIDSSKATPEINSEVEVRGKVLSFSGASVSNANIQYQIVRNTTLPYWFSRRMPMPSNNEKIIKVGSLNADDNGEFIIPFYAEADEKVASRWSPMYNFGITLDATSPSGETQSLVKNIQLGTQPYYLSTNIDDRIQLKELKKLKIFAKNIEGQEVSKKATVKLYKLKTPKKAVLPIKWETIDEPILKEKEYKSSFPRYPLKSEKAIDDFPRETQLITEQVNSNSALSLFGDIPPGAYELEVISIAENGKEVKLNQRFTLFDEEAKTPAYPVFNFFEALKSSGEPGEKAVFLVGSSMKNLRLLYEVEHDGEIIIKKWITLSKEQQKISIPIKEEYRGNFHVSFLGVNANRIVQYRETVVVPFTNKELKVELGTFRNKVEPGSKEKWTMTISGAQGDGVTAELLAGMYDQSLDKFQQRNWSMSLYQSNHRQFNWTTDRGFGVVRSVAINRQSNQLQYPYRYYPTLNWFGFQISNVRTTYMSRSFLGNQPQVEYRKVSADLLEADNSQMEVVEEAEMEVSSVRGGRADKSVTFVDGIKAKKTSSVAPLNSSIRTDFRETAFFYPQLKTDKEGKISFEFEMPDALTLWKFRALAHTQDLKVGSFEESIRTQKKLMVTPNVPRFFRENDELTFKILINNLDENFQTGYAKLNFFDASTGRRIDIFNGNSADQKFNIAPNKNSTASWKIRIPQGLKAIRYSVEVKSDDFSDGEEKIIPVLLNRMLVTESLPLAVRGNQQKNFRFEKLLSNRSGTLTHESFTVEFTPNPAWYAIQALPYITEGADECSEQIFARFYANAIAEKIANDHPRIKEVFELWKGLNSDELSSKLMKNQELKTILIEETPWLQVAKNESEQKRMIALLFDYNKMAAEKKEAVKKLKQLQLPNGGWSWYKGMEDNRYITQYIINGFGHLKKLGVNLGEDKELQSILRQGINYLDQRIEEDYENVKKYGKLSNDNLGYIQIHYLYTRSFFLENIPNTTAYNYYLNQGEKYWKGRGLYMKGMLSLALHRLKSKSATPELITASLKDNALQSEALGMYWKNNIPGYYWYKSPIETQALMVEVFQEVAKDEKSVEELRIWLLKQKQTQMWSNSKSTALACYALLIGNKQAFSKENRVSIKVGGDVLKPTNQEAGTGYFKKVYQKSEVSKNLGNISIDKKDDGIAWGAAYWQYYEDLDQISSAETEELSLSKTLFKVEQTASGEKMSPIEASAIKVGDKVRVRLRLESKRNLEFIHLKDMRASGFEPINVISRYKYQDGLGYYESTKDASTNFFMDRLNKGVYVFEYDLRASVAGEFFNGISSIQCQYAPEFSAHSKGKRVTIQ